MKSKDEKTCIILCIISGVMWILWHVYCLCDYLSYLYPYIYDVSIFISKTIITMEAPLVFVILCIIFSCLKKKEKVVTVFQVMIMFYFFLSWKAGGELLYTPTMYSYTADVSNFGKYDASDLGNAEYFPQEVPEDAQYYYFYRNSASWAWYIAVAWEHTEEEFEAQLQFMMNHEKVIRVTSDEICFDTHEGQEREYVKVIFNSESRMIYYISTSHEGYYPAESDDVFSWDPIEKKAI